MNTPRQIEKKWLTAFRQCPLLDEETGTYHGAYAYQLFYGSNDPSYPDEFPSDVSRLCKTSNPPDRDRAIEQLLKALRFIGIGIRKEMIDAHLAKYPDDFTKLTTRCYYIFRTLAHYGNSLDLSNPFRDNYGDISDLSRIESGESIRQGSQLNMFDELEVDLPILYSRFTNFPAGYENDAGVKALFDKIENSSQCFFITGKAGTGKSTFTQYFAKNTSKSVLICAFTGIAAINVGGQTIHSIFKFPLKPMLEADSEIPVFRKDDPTRLLIGETDSIIIDEVSMLRSDVLEALDYSLRVNGGDASKVFGGKQLLFIGDLFQLPPVVKLSSDLERALFQDHYKSEYFFDSPAYQKATPSFHELQKVHRQKDPGFLRLLDKVRRCEADDRDIASLNERYHPGYIPDKNKFTITLTSTNRIARSENIRRLNDLPFTTFSFEATITGEFSEDKFPTDARLDLKKESQIMFVRNDPVGRWVNGTIGKINFVSGDLLEVKLQDGTLHRIERETWENRRYKYDKVQKTIVSEVIGTFTQYPVKLAWAITIHKSQGLTFDGVVIDLGTGAFVNGQLYTALSRCRTLGGIVLKRRIRKEDLISDPRIIRFYETEKILSSSLTGEL